jgi:hypothetical protein
VYSLRGLDVEELRAFSGALSLAPGVDVGLRDPANVGAFFVGSISIFGFFSSQRDVRDVLRGSAQNPRRTFGAAIRVYCTSVVGLLALA